VDEQNSFWHCDFLRTLVYRRGRPCTNVEAITRTYADANLAGNAARCAAKSETGIRRDDESSRRRSPLHGCAERLATDDDDLSGNGEEHRRRSRGTSRRRLQFARDRPRRHRNLRLADSEGHHMRAVEISRPEYALLRA